MQPTDEQIETLWWYTQVGDASMKEFVRRFRALFSASKPAAPAQSPEAWLYDFRSSLNVGWKEEFSRLRPTPSEWIRNVTPLYTTPQASSTAVVLDDDACTHDYVRPDSICTECGERAAVVLDDERAAILRDLMQHASEVCDHTPDSFSKGVIALANRARAASPQPVPSRVTNGHIKALESAAKLLAETETAMAEREKLRDARRAQPVEQTRAADPRILAEEWHAAFINKCGYQPDAEDGYVAGYRSAARPASGETE
jgi:hypothetical protein